MSDMNAANDQPAPPVNVPVPVPAPVPAPAQTYNVYEMSFQSALEHLEYLGKRPVRQQLSADQARDLLHSCEPDTYFIGKPARKHYFPPPGPLLNLFAHQRKRRPRKHSSDDEYTGSDDDDRGRDDNQFNVVRVSDWHINAEGHLEYQTEWETGEITWEPVTAFVDKDAVTEAFETYCVQMFAKVRDALGELGEWRYLTDSKNREIGKLKEELRVLKETALTTTTKPQPDTLRAVSFTGSLIVSDGKITGLTLSEVPFVPT